MSVDKKFFMKCLTQGIPVYGAHSGDEYNFTHALNEYLEAQGSGEYFCYIGDQRNTLFFEVKINSPILGLAVENEMLTFFQEDPQSIHFISENEKLIMGEVTLHVVAFVSAWNKKTMSIQSKDEYNSLARMKEKYNVHQLKKIYEINLIKYKEMKQK